jgi:transcriptional regulator with XRE-family HTH domain
VPTAHSPDDSRARLLGQRLRELRASQSLTQEAVAHAAGLTRNHYQLLEAGITATGRPANPRLSTIVALAEALKVAPEDLIK